jgi:uncharacterized membrane protein YphA (DoxX/SURF4 family)
MAGSKTTEYTLTGARLVLGASALMHGIGNTFGLWAAERLGGTSAHMAARMALPADWLFHVISVGLVVAGLTLVLGVATRGGSLFVLLVAIWHGIANGRFGAFFDQAGGCEDLLMVGALALVVATHGPGAYRFAIKREGKK